MLPKQTPRDLLNRGYSKFKLYNYEESRKLFEEAAALDHSSAEAHAWPGCGLWPSDRSRLGHDGEDQAAFDIGKRDQRRTRNRFIAGACQKNERCQIVEYAGYAWGDSAAAVDEFLYCINQGMDEAEVWVSLAECYIKTYETSKAIDDLKEALAREPHNTKAVELLQHINDESSEELE